MVRVIEEVIELIVTPSFEEHRYHVESEIARPSLPDNGIEIGAKIHLRWYQILRILSIPGLILVSVEVNRMSLHRQWLFFSCLNSPLADSFDVLRRIGTDKHGIRITQFHRIGHKLM